MKVFKNHESWPLNFATGRKDVRVEYADGSSYEGRVRYGVKDGQGIYTSADKGFYYKGNWSNDRCDSSF